MTDKEIIKALEDLIENFDGKAVDFMIISVALNLINRQKAEIERLREERDRTVKDFTEFARTAYDIPFACKYCAHSIEDGRACLWKAEHEDEEACLGRHFEYKGMVGEG